MISIENLSKSYGSKIVLENINFNFLNGKVYGIVGENGAGKTTLFNCIAGLEKHEGIVKYEFGLLKNYLGYLQTEPYFFPKITGNEYIKLLCNARNISSTDLGERNIFDLPLDEYAVKYSTGMKKKLALTALLLQENKVIILDEPFNGVDIQSNIIIIEIIQKLKEMGKSIIISSHIFSTLSDTCDEIMLLKNGRIIQSVLKDQFSVLENEMKLFTIGNKIERLNLK
ncbi:ATP-binding cassette domain-containing protein [Flavobacterium sp. CHNK8]|uniref:ATP-binding cassette domain-containing protein n=1 Tax=Flavobacterium sp. CHNK8 TaxID=2871165 RepID=UPI001C8CFEFF|nr:ATP-binding cassette domain-containing protein [Flavobacterium sp. CHNK8]QZK90159.1 ATP-binding cassette domain-containing protein [Flavobacterium sp. CHNK8]